jgi:hypothetical protein
VTPKNAVRVPSNPDITSGIRSFRITIVRPKPNARKIPMMLAIEKSTSFDNEVWIILSGSVPSPNEEDNKSFLCMRGGRMNPCKMSLPF